MKRLLSAISLLICLLGTQTALAAPWHSWQDVTLFPSMKDYDFSRVKTVHYEVYDINATAPTKCRTHCFRVAVYVNGEKLAVVPTSPGSEKYSWGSRTPEIVNAPLVGGVPVKSTWGHKGYRLHNKDYLTKEKPGRTRSNLRYFTVILFNGVDEGIGFHGDKDGKFEVTGKPESHGCMRLTDYNAQFVNLLARAVIDNTRSGNGVTTTINDTEAKWF